MSVSHLDIKAMFPGSDGPLWGVTVQNSKHDTSAYLLQKLVGEKPYEHRPRLR